MIAVGVMLAASPRGSDRAAPRPRPRAGGAPRRRPSRCVGAVALAVLLSLVTVALDLRAAGDRRRALERPSRVTAAAQRPSSLAGLSLALRSRRRAGVRLALATTAGAGLLAGVATVVVSGRAVVDDPQRYGVDFDVLAFNSFGDQTAAGIERVFGGPEVTVSASYTSYPMLVDGRTVPGLSVTPIRGESGPTMLEGEPVRHDDEVVLGVDTADRLGVDVGDEVQVQSGQRLLRSVRRPRRCRCASSGSRRSPPSRSRGPTRRGSASARSSPGRPSKQLLGSDENLPEWTTASLADGTDPTELIDSQPRRRRGRARGRDAVVHRCATRRAPAARRGLAGARRCHRGRPPAPRRRARPGRLVAHPSERAPSCRCSRPSGAPAPSSPAPRRGRPFQPGLAALVIGVPLGIAVGRLAFSAFARSIAVVDDPSSPPWLVVALVLAVARVGRSGRARGRAGRAPRRERRHPPRRRSPPRLTPPPTRVRRPQPRGLERAGPRRRQR